MGILWLLKASIDVVGVRVAYLSCTWAGNICEKRMWLTARTHRFLRWVVTPPPAPEIAETRMGRARSKLYHEVSLQNISEVIAKKMKFPGSDEPSPRTFLLMRHIL